MSTTTYYGLNKPEGSNLVNPLTDTFPNWDIVDAQMYKNFNLGVTGATETVLAGVHAIVRAETDLPFFHFTAVANFSSGDTFTLDGVSVNAYTPDGNTLVGGAFVSGANILGYYNSTNSSITLYLNTTSGSGGSINADTLDGHDSTYFATASVVGGIVNDIGNEDISAIGDGTITGAIKSTNTLVNTVNSKVGDLVNLLTSAKNNLVSAINEVVGRLTANGNALQLDYQNGKYGFVVDSVFYPLGGGDMQKNYTFAGENPIVIDISDFDDNDSVTIGGTFTSNSPSSVSEKVTISTIKTWTTEHEITVYISAKVKVLYSNGKISLYTTGATLGVIGFINFND